MHKRATLLLYAAFVALSSFAAEPLRVWPVAPTTREWFGVRVLAPGCVASIVDTFSALPQRIDVRITAGACPTRPFVPAFTGPTDVDENFAPRPAGEYHITVRWQDGAKETILSEGRLIIHEDVPDVEVQPWVLNVAGGTELHVRGHLPLCPEIPCPETGIVTIDGQPFTAPYVRDELIVDAAPPHAEGAADVGIRYNGKELQSNALLYYYDARSEPEWSVFEPVLLPVLDSGPGLLGSMWETEGMIARLPSYLVGPGAPASDNDTAGFRKLAGRGFPHGAIVAIPRRESALTHLALRLREVSRNADGYGTELPVVHERDFQTSGQSLYDVPVGPRFRSKLRVYSIHRRSSDQGQATVTITRSGTNRYVLTAVLRWTAPHCAYESCTPAYADLDLDSLPNAEVRAGGRFDLRFSVGDTDMWGFVTVVDNVTQSVSVISPR
jgi:hypothetical protein